MKLRFPLYIQIALLVALNIAFLLVLRLLILQGPVNLGWDSLFYTPICDRLQGLSFGMHHQLKNLPKESWGASLAESGKYYGVNLYIFDNKGNIIQKHEGTFNNLVWSPDSKFLTFGYFEQESKKLITLILDIENWQLHPLDIPENSKVINWVEIQ